MIFLFSIFVTMGVYAIKNSLMHISMYYGDKDDTAKKNLFHKVESNLGGISLFFTLSTFVTAAYYFLPYFFQFM